VLAELKKNRPPPLWESAADVAGRGAAVLAREAARRRRHPPADLHYGQVLCRRPGFAP
jgi:hypothetical protein